MKSEIDFMFIVLNSHYTSVFLYIQEKINKKAKECKLLYFTVIFREHKYNKNDKVRDLQQ